MKFISPQLHGALDYLVAAVLVGAPFILRFAAVSVASAVIAVAAGIALFAYSLLTAYSAGGRALIPFGVHLVLDAMVALALLAAPFLFGFIATPRTLFVAIGVGVLAVVACTRVQEERAHAIAPLHSTSTLTS